MVTHHRWDTAIDHRWDTDIHHKWDTECHKWDTVLQWEDIQVWECHKWECHKWECHKWVDTQVWEDIQEWEDTQEWDHKQRKVRPLTLLHNLRQNTQHALLLTQKVRQELLEPFFSHKLRERKFSSKELFQILLQVSTESMFTNLVTLPEPANLLVDISTHTVLTMELMTIQLTRDMLETLSN